MLLNFNTDHTKYKFPGAGVDAKRQETVIKNLNVKCRGCRKKIEGQG